MLVATGGNAASAAALVKSMEAPQETKEKAPYNPAIPRLGIHPKASKNTNSKNMYNMQPMFSIVYYSWDMEATKVSINRWMDKDKVGCVSHHIFIHYLYNGILRSHEKEWNSAICRNMDGPRGY